jgi:Mn-dependent DtxR family transcriptional regulator
MKNFNLIINGVLNMPNLKASEKLVMIHLWTMKSLGTHECHTEISSSQLNYSRPGYSKILKRLIEMGYVEYGSKRGWYKLTETNIF